MVSPCAAAGGALRAACSSDAIAPWWRGKYSVIAVPSPRRELTCTWPWDCRTKLYSIDRPSPVPTPAALVVKKGSKMRCTVSAAIPQPVSVTRSRR
ncbi:hypothetical protein G6F59_017770 [Rhizopus arrhizus]|nr:hypothetical protein G6F59_017770 [Rhizopus arrhizus]